MKITKDLYLQSMGVAVIVLALVRCAVPSVTGETVAETLPAEATDSVLVSPEEVPSVEPIEEAKIPIASLEDKNFEPHPIYSVPSFKNCFPDSNEVQLQAARKYGVKPVRNREDAEARKKELVYAAADPFYHVDKLRESIPYLVPRAQFLLHDIGRSFYDSLYVKGIALHKIIVTSVLRSEEDVARLRRHNGNASENSCHRFGTTFDICYNRYVTVEDPDGPSRWQVRNDTLKWVLSEVLNDYRKNGRCYIKYEVKQGCFHITTR